MLHSIYFHFNLNRILVAHAKTSPFCVTSGMRTSSCRQQRIRLHQNDQWSTGRRDIITAHVFTRWRPDASVLEFEAMDSVDGIHSLCTGVCSMAYWVSHTGSRRMYTAIRTCASKYRCTPGNKKDQAPYSALGWGLRVSPPSKSEFERSTARLDRRLHPYDGKSSTETA